MSITHSVAARNAAANAVVALVDQGGAHANGRLVLLDTNNNVLSTMQLSKPAFQAAAQGACAANAIANDPAPVIGGIVASYQVQDCNWNPVWSGTVGPSNDLGFPNQAIPPAGVASVVGLTYVAPP